MMAGKLDRRIVIQQATETQDEFGQPVKTWATFASRWASRRDMKGSERFAAQQQIASRTAVYRLYWLSGVTEEMRVVDGSTYEIRGIAEDRRQGWLELTCEAINPAAVS